MTNYTASTTFECDLYTKIRQPDEVLTAVKLLQGAVTEIQMLTSVKDTNSAYS